MVTRDHLSCFVISICQIKLYSNVLYCALVFLASIHSWRWLGNTDFRKYFFSFMSEFQIQRITWINQDIVLLRKVINSQASRRKWVLDRNYCQAWQKTLINLVKKKRKTYWSHWFKITNIKIFNAKCLKVIWNQIQIEKYNSIDTINII